MRHDHQSAVETFAAHCRQAEARLGIFETAAAHFRCRVNDDNLTEQIDEKKDGRGAHPIAVETVTHTGQQT